MINEITWQGHVATTLYEFSILINLKKIFFILLKAAIIK